MFKDKKVLVAGGAGFVGVNLINRLLLLGADVRATIHKKPPVISDDKIEYITCDLMEKEDCRRAAEDVDYVFMCAANTSGAGVMAKTPLVHVTPNILMNTLLLDAAYTAGVKKFLFLSSNTVYPAVDHPVKEDEMVPGNVFEKYYCVAWMKQFSEILCRMYAEKIEKPMKTVIVRPANIYGPYDDFEWETSHVLPALMRKVVERHPVVGAKILDEVERQLGIKAGETTEDLEYTLETIACFGSCALAPVMVVDKTVYGRMTPSKVKSVLTGTG